MDELLHDQAALFAYYVVGVFVMAATCRKLNGPLSILDLLVSLVAAVFWPALLLFVGFILALTQDGWLTKRRF